MKSRSLIIFAIVMVGVVGTAFASHDPNQPLEHSIILPLEIKEKSFDEFMEWCVPHFGEKCIELEKKRTPIIKPPLKQINSGVKFHNVVCKDNLELTYKKSDDTSACVTLDTKIELVVRGWANDDRLLLGCTSARYEKCYPSDHLEYRKALYDYYFDDSNLPSPKSFDFVSLQTINACSDQSICFGKFDNGTKMRVSCDYPTHGCTPTLFGNYRETSTVRIPLGAIIVENKHLDPETITVVLGKNNTVVWINDDDVPHGIVSDNGGDNFWGTGTILPSESASVIFNQTGVFEYYGMPHPWIKGKVIVLPTDYDEQTCAHLFDLSMNAFSDYVGDQEELGVIGISPQPDDLIFHSEFFEEWRYAGCMYSVDGWSDLSEHENFLKQVVKWESKNEN